MTEFHAVSRITLSNQCGVKNQLEDALDCFHSARNLLSPKCVVNLYRKNDLYLKMRHAKR